MAIVKYCKYGCGFSSESIRDVTEHQKTSHAPNAIGCCLCFCLTGVKQAATKQIDGYWVCDEHAQWMAQPFTDFADLVRRVKHNTTRNAT